MSASKVTMIPNGLSKSLNIPIELSWDYQGLDQSIELYEEEVITEVIGVGRDFEVSRFANEPYTSATQSLTAGTTDINYEFYFYSGGSLTASANWQMDYLFEGFTTQDIYYYNNNFSNSFFKLDFYDSRDEKKQINYLTIIIPTQQGFKKPAVMQRTPVEIKYPKFKLDYVGDQEGFFIYWLKKRDFLNIDIFYMSAKFYNAEKGYFVKMMNQGQFTMGGSPNNFDNLRYFYYPVKLDYSKQTYRVLDFNLNRVGMPQNPVRWYEYVNPPLQ